jgi:diphthine-ammonia ligase
VKAVVSWSGGKDCYLALERAVEQGVEPVALLTMLTERGERSRSHGLPVAALELQAQALALPLVTRAATWDGYEAAFVDALSELVDRHGVEAGVFGDIDGAPNRAWVEAACERAGITPIEPLWAADRAALLAELDERGVSAVITVVRDGVLDAGFIGRSLGTSLAGELAAAGVDLCGELGEFHTVVLDGARFAFPLELASSHVVAREGVHVLDVELARGAHGVPPGIV